MLALLQSWLIFLPLLLLPLLYFLSTRNDDADINKSWKLPPSPPKLPVIGHLHLVSKLPHRSFLKLSQKYGPVMMLKMGRVRALVVSSTETSKEVMKTHDLECCSRPPSAGPALISYDYKMIIFAPYDEYWREMRKFLVLELLSMKRVQSFNWAREFERNRLIQTLTEASAERRIVHLDELIFRQMDNFIAKVAFGDMQGKAEFRDIPFQKVMDEAMIVLGSFATEDFFPKSPLGSLVDTLSGLKRRRVKLQKKMDEYIEKMIDAHMDPTRPKPEREDLVDILLGLQKSQNTPIPLHRVHVKALLLCTFLAAIDTSAITVIWTMAELMKSPRALKKCQAEIRKIMGKKPVVDAEDVEKLDYMKLAVKEALRLHPPGTLLIPRYTMQHCQIGGYDIPPNTRVYVNAWVLGRDPAVWDKPDEYYPERFEGVETDFKGSHYEYVPFGAGRRQCPGMTMGMTNVEYNVANLLHCFDWELPPGVRPEDLSMMEEGFGGLTYHRRDALMLIPTKYNQ